MNATNVPNTKPAPDPSWRHRAFLTLLYEMRPCFICQKKAWCTHREPLVDLAEHRLWMGE